MDRREFLLNTAKASGVVLPWWGLLPLANAQASTGKLLLYYHCDGGWDTDSFSDPAIGAGINTYTTAGTPVPRVGRMAIAPKGNNGSNAAFLQRFNSQLIFVNGCNTQTNSHEDGSYASSTGRLEMGYAPLCELHAAKFGPGYAAAWMNNDDARAAMSTGLVTATPVPDGNQLRAMVTPNAANATQDRMKQADYQKTIAARDARLQALKASGVMLPKDKLITEQMIAGKEARVRLETVASLIPATFTNGFADLEVAAIAMQAGVTAAAQVRSGGFDCHGSVDGDYDGPNGALNRMTTRLTFMMDEAQRRGIADRLLVVVGAEFGRSLLNGSMGKDHNNVGGAYVIILPQGTGLGDRVVGYTGPRHETRTINPTTGAPDPNGIVINPKHVHTAIHEYLGFQSSAPGGLGVPAAEKLKLFSATCHTGHPSLPA